MESNIGYIISHSAQSNTYIGALMVTDYKGLPLEYKYTEPITPTRLQSIIHGQYIHRYLKVDVILTGLYRSLSIDVDFIICEDTDFLDNDIKETLTIAYSQSKSAPLAEVGEIAESSDHEYLIQTTNSSSPYKVTLPQKYRVTDKVIKTLNEKILFANQYTDITEPLQRTKDALEEVCKQKLTVKK